MRNEIILIGAGGHSVVCADVIEQENSFDVAGYVERERSEFRMSNRFPLLGIDDDLAVLREDYSNALITVGQIKSPDVRINLYKKLKSLSYTLPVIVSPIAYVAKSTKIGEGTIIMHGAIINSGARIGVNCIINSKALVEHDAIIGDNCHVSTGAIVNGGVRVSSGTFIGSGVITKQSIEIGKNCVIGAGCIIKEDVPDNRLVTK
jgi:sugar O-acyltransferase (sialic acid O-acetyltransferase NeuD family)